MQIQEHCLIHLHFTCAEVQRRNVIMKACKAVGSVSETCFDIRFNPDVCSPGIKHTLAHIQTLVDSQTETQQSVLQVFVSPRSVLQTFRGRGCWCGTPPLFYSLTRSQQWWVFWGICAWSWWYLLCCCPSLCVCVCVCASWGTVLTSQQCQWMEQHWPQCCTSGVWTYATLALYWENLTGLRTKGDSDTFRYI